MRNVNNVLLLTKRVKKKAETQCLLGKASRGKCIVPRDRRKAQELIIPGAPECRGEEADSRLEGSVRGSSCPKCLSHPSSQVAALPEPGRKQGSLWEDHQAGARNLRLGHR